MQTQPVAQAVAAPGSTAIRYARPVGRFVFGFMEMCAAMCAGGLVLSVVFFQGAALIGYPNFFQQNFLISVLVLGINWALAMGIYMAIRGHPLAHNLEMASTSIVAALALIAAYSWFGLAHKSVIPGWFGQFLFQCGPSCVLMGADMLFRFRHYTGSAERHAQHMA